MTAHSLAFDSISEARPGPKWRARWDRSWPDYEAWFLSRGGAAGPSRAQCEAALDRHMPEIAPIYRRLASLAGEGDLAARFLSTWCPPAYLSGCSLAAVAADGQVRLARNYDLSPELNEGLLLRSEWTGAPAMGMIEFLWGLSDGVNAAGLALALAYGGRLETAPGFGVTTILRYVIETCGSVEQALAVLRRVPSHMAYNVTLADRHGATATAELVPGGGARIVSPAIATNHQQGQSRADRPSFTRTFERRAHLERLLGGGVKPDALAAAFLKEPLFQTGYDEGLGTLFTAECDPLARSLTLRWPDQEWRQTIDDFAEGRRLVRYGRRATVQVEADDPISAIAKIVPHLAPAPARSLRTWVESARASGPDWAAIGRAFHG